MHFELSIARRAYVLARAAGLVRSVPDFPQIRNLHVRMGFLDPRQWEQVRARLRPIFAMPRILLFFAAPAKWKP